MPLFCIHGVYNRYMVGRGGPLACGIDGGILRLAVALGFAKKVEV